MQLPSSDVDFYERKIFRLETDIASLNEQLTIVRSRLRSAQDFQIKYQLLLRQSQQESVRIRKIEQSERMRLTELISSEVEIVNKEWTTKVILMEQDIRQQHKEQREKLETQIAQLKDKNREMASKIEQVDELVFKNKKTAKDLQVLEAIVEESKLLAERQRVDEVKQCKEELNKKYTDKMNIERQHYQQAISKLEEKYQKLELQLMKAELIARQRSETNSGLSRLSRFGTEAPLSNLSQQITNLQKIIDQKDANIGNLQSEKLAQEQKQKQNERYLKNYIKQLEDKLFQVQQNHQIELINLKSRMNEIRVEEIKAKEKQCEQIERQHIKEMELHNQKIVKEKAQLEIIRKMEEAEIAKLKQEKQKLQKKIIQLKNRLKDHEDNRDAGDTQILINSLINMDKKEDEAEQYENGVTFLERQLRKANIKIEKKNQEVSDLVNKLSRLSQEYENESQQTKQKYLEQIKTLNDKIHGLEEDIKQLNQHIRSKDKQIRDQDAQYMKKMNQINAENRSLHNLNNDLQRDYNRILESKKVIEKSFRQERERSITSKSEIAVTKKQKWIELERQKNQIQIIYKEKQVQLKTGYQSMLSQLRVENDKLKRSQQLMELQLNNLKDKLKILQSKDESQKQKQNLHSDFNKKLATVDLQIALTENLYHSLIKAKSRIKRPEEHDAKRQQQSAPRSQKPNLGPQQPRKKVKNYGVEDFEQYIKRTEQVSSKREQKQRKLTEVQKLSSNSSHDMKGQKQDANEIPLSFYSDEDGNASPTFNMFQSFNKRGV